MSSQEKPLSQANQDRRATPAFDGSPIPDADLRKILQAGLNAPSGYNAQPWRFVVVRDPQQRTALQAAAFNQTKVGNASAVLVACGDLDSWKSDLDELIEEGKKTGYIANAQIEKSIRTNYTVFRGGAAGDNGGEGADGGVGGERHTVTSCPTI